MNIQLLLTFIVLSIVNVILQTTNTLCTVKATKLVSAFMSAVTFGFYTIIIVYTVCDLPLYIKVLIVAILNFCGVFFVKTIEEKLRKDKLWKIELTVDPKRRVTMLRELQKSGIPYNLIVVDKYVIFNCYCATQAESETIKKIGDKFYCKYFVSESKVL